jgi:hypothetical protein
MRATTSPFTWSARTAASAGAGTDGLITPETSEPIRQLYQFYTSTKSPLAAAVLAKITELYAIEAEIRGQPAEHRRQVLDDGRIEMDTNTVERAIRPSP